MKTYLPSMINTMQCIMLCRKDGSVIRIMTVKANVAMTTISVVIELNDVLSSLM